MGSCTMAIGHYHKLLRFNRQIIGRIVRQSFVPHTKPRAWFSIDFSECFASKGYSIINFTKFSPVGTSLNGLSDDSRCPRKASACEKRIADSANLEGTVASH